MCRVCQLDICWVINTYIVLGTSVDKRKPGEMLCQSFKFSFRYHRFKSSLVRSKQGGLFSPPNQPVDGWTVVDDRIVPGIFKTPEDGVLNDTKLSVPFGKWFSSVPRCQTGKYGRDMIGFTLGLGNMTVYEAMLESSLWVVDGRGRVKYGNLQIQHCFCPEDGVEYCWIRHPLPHDVR